MFLAFIFVGFSSVVILPALAGHGKIKVIIKNL